MAKKTKAKKTDPVIELLTSIDRRLAQLAALADAANRHAGCYETVREFKERQAKERQALLPAGYRFMNEPPKNKIPLPKKGE